MLVSSGGARAGGPWGPDVRERRRSVSLGEIL